MQKKQCGRQEIELYIHIPFCVRKCNYCDFLSFPASKEVQDRYMEALLTEVAGRSKECRDYVVSSIFIGGGTPSIVDAEAIQRLLCTIHSNYTLCKDVEITMEVNPGTVDSDKLSLYRWAGINRLSIGLQSASDEELQYLGRIHTYRQFRETYLKARKAGFSNINVDLMSALPGQSMESYEETLQTVLSLKPRPEHISAYSLIVEEGTPFFELYEQGSLPLPDEEVERQMYYRTRELLKQAGYERYEISNYSLPGFACRHNIGYWIRKSYLGFGIGAASLFKETRFSNTQDLEAYCNAPLSSGTSMQPLSVQEQMEETLFLGLRMMQGITDEQFEEKFARSLMSVYAPVIEQGQRDGLLIHDKGRLFLTDKGIDLSNYVLAQFLL